MLHTSVVASVAAHGHHTQDPGQVVSMRATCPVCCTAQDKLGRCDV